jgi:CRP-like cAMP-binding protein/CheY-like chemotaxis protein
MNKILVVENDENDRHRMVATLQLSNYMVVCASDGREAVQMARTVHPDLIVCNSCLPDIDGYGVLHTLRQTPGFTSLPFILLASIDNKEEFRKAMREGADDFLAMPFEGIELLRAVESSLARNQRLARHPTLSKTGPEIEMGPDHLLSRTWDPADRSVLIFRKKEIIYREGQRASHVWYIVRGKIKTYRVHDDGKELITNVHGPGDFIGYAAALEGNNYKDNARVLDEAGVIQLSSVEFLHILTEDPGLFRCVIGSLAHQVAEKDEDLLNKAYNSLRKRVANGLLLLTDKFRTTEAGDRIIQLSRENLASIIGAAPESLTRTLSDFRKEKLIEIEDGRIHLLNLEKLRKMIN